MTRTKTSVTTKKNEKTLKQGKVLGSQSKLFRTTKQRVMKSLLYSFSDRRKNKYDQLWINRINCGLKISAGIKHKYNTFIHYLKKHKFLLNKKLTSNVNLKDEICFY
uniref:Ribosomal protein L20 n=1 Tax=Euglena hiemalis TaxID=392896 RepID=A0A345UC64_9EUGL|nr:ribosomal protein L20 [Euglena hiemalis]AXI98050.1 ribosomal protein L20 [Euglena hiemalis]